MRIDLERCSRISENVVTDVPRLRSQLDDRIQRVHERMLDLRSKGLFLREDSNKLGRFYVDLVGVFRGKLAWLCWMLGESTVRHYHRWRDSCDKRVSMDEKDIDSWEQSLSELTFFVLR